MDTPRLDHVGHQVENLLALSKYRAELRKYYYDSTKHKTCLDQLGIKYPTIR